MFVFQDYAICFRRSAGDCQLRLTRSAAAPDFSTNVGAVLPTSNTGCGGENGEKNNSN